MLKWVIRSLAHTIHKPNRLQGQIHSSLFDQENCTLKRSWNQSEMRTFVGEIHAFLRIAYKATTYLKHSIIITLIMMKCNDYLSKGYLN